MREAIVRNNIFFLVVLCLKALHIAPVCGWLASPAGNRRGRALLVPSDRINKNQATALFSKKKGGAASTTAKVQIKLLKNVPGTGQAGEVILVTPAFFNNKLLPTHLAKLISDAQVEQEQVAQIAKQQEADARAIQLKERIELLEPSSLVMRRKVGPTGHLFGGVGPKMVMELLCAAVPDDFLTQQKNVKITAVMDADGQSIPGDIKSIGTFRATISLTKARSATLQFMIVAEDV
jgi:ribosomal protein L9